MDLVSPHPFWPIKNGLIEVYPPLRSDLNVDAVILGAGITGAILAERLSREGLSIAVVDKREATLGSTSASTSLLQYEIDTPLTQLTRMIGREDAGRAYQLCRDSIASIEELVKRTGTECAFQRKKSVYLAAKKSQVRELRAECEARRKLGITVEFWTPEELRARFSFDRPGALVTEPAAELDCHRLAHALLQRAIAQGAQVFDRTEITRTETEKPGVRLRTNRKATLRARWAIHATGYESQSLLPHRVVSLKSTYALASEPLEGFPGWWETALLWEAARPYLYLRTTPDGRAMIGGEDDAFRNPERRDRRVFSKTEKLAAKFRRLFPDIGLEVAYRWAGTFGETRDGLAYIGTVRQFPHSYFALGFGGNGITYSAIAADLVSNALLGRPNPDLRLFRFDR